MLRVSQLTGFNKRLVTAVTPIALVASASAQNPNSNVVTTAGINTTGATMLVVGVAWYRDVGNNTASVTDSKGNTWTALTQQNGNNNFATRMWYVLNPIVGSAHTFTASHGSLIYPSIGAAAFSGVKTSGAVDQQNGNKSATGTVQPGSITPTESNELLVTSLYFIANVAPSIDSGFTLMHEQHAASGLSDFGFAYKVQTAAAEVNPTWTATGATDLSTAIVSFKHA